MLHHPIPLVLFLAALFLSVHANAHPSRAAFEAVAAEALIVERVDGTRVQGTLAHIDDARAILVDEDGEVHDIALESVTRLRVAKPVAAAGKISASTNDPSVSSTQTSGYFDKEPGSEGYLTPEQAADSENPFAGHPYEAPNARYGVSLLSYQDYTTYQSMLDASQYKRMVGWSLFATGLGFLALMTAQVRDARRVHQKPRVRAFATVGGLTTAVGLPVAIAGRQQYKRAQRFAENAAVHRRQAFDDARKRDAALQAPEAPPARSEIGYTRDHIQPLNEDASNEDAPNEDETLNQSAPDEDEQAQDLEDRHASDSDSTPDAP